MRLGRDGGWLPGEQGLATQQMDALPAAASGNLGPLHEQVDPDSGAMLGNMPQALSYLALAHAALEGGVG